MGCGLGMNTRKRVGRSLCLFVSAAVTLNGAGWFFYGPSLATFEQDTGIKLASFVDAYPAAAELISLQARNSAVLLIGLGLMGALRILSDRGDAPRLMRNAGWVFGGTLAAVGLVELFAGAGFGVAYLGLGLLALVGQALSGS